MLPATPDAASRTVLALDAGQTGVRARLSRGPKVLGEVELAAVVTDRPVAPQLADRALEASELLSGSASVLAIGSSGLTAEESVVDVKAHLGSSGIGQVFLAHDSVTSYLGALGDNPGAVVAAGTGVVTLAVGRERTARVDGWGNLIGDAGSGYWIGRAGLEAVMRAHDGRGPATALSAPVRRDFDEDLEGAYMVLQADEQRVRRIAAWSRTVAELAESGDEVCRGICTRAGEELAVSALAGLRRVDEDTRPHPVVSTVGKVFSSAVVREAFHAHLWQALDGVQIAPPRGTGLDGAAQLPFVSHKSALQPQIEVVS
ncbi:N-acetylglucosamine kinase [Luteococcus sp. Sow4_B9]|uniref:N-acetylglucosamine kinase n=1 Tax=Luteococcus sp. Sow4_B9 TaxID=3438792 RepID=UPI003F9E4B44